MGMVASSVLLTVFVLNFHHRNPDTHTMPTWVGVRGKLETIKFDFVNKDQEIIPTMAALAAAIPETKQENHNKIHNDGEQDGCKDIKVQLSSKLSYS